MKKLCPFLLLFSLQLNAQDYSTKLGRTELNKETPTIKPGITVKDGSNEENGFINNVPSAVLRSFVDRYEYVSEVSWFVDDGKATAAFKSDGCDYIVTYNRAGEAVCTRKSYPGELLTMRVNNMLVHEIQKGFRVSYVTEVEHEQQTRYEISLQNEKQWLVIKIHKDHLDGSLEMVDRKAFLKG